MRTMKIGNRLIGEGEPCFIIAEAGVNHNGDISLAKRLVDVAEEAGVDAVKFQTFVAEELVTESAEKAGYQKETTRLGESQLEMLKKLELTEKDSRELFAYSQDKNMLFLSTPFDRGSVDLLYELGVNAFKIGSGEITNLPLLKHIARKGKPIILSTGMATLGEIEEAVETLREEGAEEFVLLHCVTNYPARIEDMNLKVLETLRSAFKLPVGLSDHSLGITMPIAAVALGACVVEKHFTLDKNLPGPDHKASLGPDELEQMVKAIREVEAASGDGLKRPTAGEEEIKKVARRSIVARVNIPQGTIVTEEMLAIKRPGIGLEPKYVDRIIGKAAKRDIKKDELLTGDEIHWG